MKSKMIVYLVLLIIVGIVCFTVGCISQNAKAESSRYTLISQENLLGVGIYIYHDNVYNTTIYCYGNGISVISDQEIVNSIASHVKINS